MLTRLSRGFSNPNLLSNPSLLSNAAKVEEEEHGTWHYLVVDARGVRPRTGSTYSKESKTQQSRIKDGTVICVSQRRRAGLTRWLCVGNGQDWIHDVSPKDHRVRAVEVEVLSGTWQYQVTAERVAILPKPSLHLTEFPPKAAGLDFGENVGVVRRIRPLNSKGSFLELSDGRGFAFDMAKGVQVLHLFCRGVELVSSPSNRLPGGLPGDAPPATATAAAPPATAALSSNSSEVACDYEQPLAALRTSSTRSSELGPPELGSWDYIVLDPAGIRLRGAPAYDKGEKLSSRLPAGELAHVVERRVCSDGTTFVRLESPAGWAFDVQPGASHRKRQRMAQVSVEHGTWFYRVVANKGVAFRARCSLTDEAKLGKGPDLGAMLTIRQRVRVGSTVFLKVDGHDGWLFDCKDDKELVRGPIDMTSHNGAFGTVRAEDPKGLHLLSSPTSQRWARTNRHLLNGARVQLIRTCQVEDERWTFVSQRGGMEGWSFAFNFDGQVDEPPQPPEMRQHKTYDAELLRSALNASSPVAAF